MKYYRYLNHLIMDERIKARYINPMVDWSFKQLFDVAEYASLTG